MEDIWIKGWLTPVADGTSDMSQRSMTTVLKHGGIDRVIADAQALGVHLAEITDEQGRMTIVASRFAFRVLC